MHALTAKGKDFANENLYKKQFEIATQGHLIE